MECRPVCPEKACPLSSSIKITPASRDSDVGSLCQATVGWVDAKACPAIPDLEWPFAFCLCH